MERCMFEQKCFSFNSMNIDKASLFLSLSLGNHMSKINVTFSGFVFWFIPHRRERNFCNSFLSPLSELLYQLIPKSLEF